ncbi:MAG: hypothetical protein ACREFR_12510 [Limisphaerales bacterium]
MVIWFTTLSLALAYGWLAGFVRQPDGDLTFHWRWRVAIWAFIGLASAAYFWGKAWRSDNRKPPRLGLLKATVVLAVPGIWWLIFPLRSLSGERFWQVIEGLAVAAVVLAFGAWMILRLARAFEDK